MTWSKAACLSLLAFLAPVKALLISCIFLCLTDCITGVLIAYRAGGWEAVTSAELRRTFSKAILFMLGIILAHVFDTVFFKKEFLVPIVSGGIGVLEARSIYENLNILSGTNLFKSTIAMIGSKNASNEEKPK